MRFKHHFPLAHVRTEVYLLVVRRRLPIYSLPLLVS